MTKTHLQQSRISKFFRGRSPGPPASRGREGRGGEGREGGKERGRVGGKGKGEERGKGREKEGREGEEPPP